MELYVKDGAYCWSRERSQDAIASLAPMLVEEYDELHTAHDAGFLSRDHIDDLGNGLFRVCRRVTNQSGRTRRVKLVAQLERGANTKNNNPWLKAGRQTVDKSKTTVIFHKEKRIRMSNI